MSLEQYLGLGCRTAERSCQVDFPTLAPAEGRARDLDHYSLRDLPFDSVILP